MVKNSWSVLLCIDVRIIPVAHTNIEKTDLEGIDAIRFFYYFFLIRFTPFIRQIHINRDNKVGKFKQLRCISYFQKEY